MEVVMEEEHQTQPNSNTVGIEVSMNDSKTCPWSFSTNWTISRGSLDASIAVESSDLPIESESTSPKLPLVLEPSSSASGQPCEIKISFTQKHEIRQVYVRSTARVYEIYYSPSAQSEDEYLCTVRCSIADRDDDLLRAIDIEEASTGSPSDANMVRGSSTSPREDDWVEVKIPTATRNFKDFYEATAEISDVDPCMSITLRLLSLQSKGRVYIGEVYVFADTIETVDSEHQTIQVENSAGTNLMAMLVPTLLQLSKSRVSEFKDEHASSSKENHEYLETQSGKSRTTTAGGSQQAEPSRVKLQETYGATLEPNHFQVPAEALKNEGSNNVLKNDQSSIQVERVLEQLVSRMSRIEDICLRFEENMVKPINSMLERLERVEQQVEVIAKNSPCSQLLSGTIFSAPAFSNESNSSSFSNEGNSFQSCGPSENGKKNITTTSDTCNQPGATSNSVSLPRFLPSLMVTAPEFSCCDEEEENDVLEPQKECPQGKPKQTLSIDDALAAALAGFSSTPLSPSLLDTKAFTTETPEFTIEKNGDDVALEEMGNEEKVSEASPQEGKSLGPSSSDKIEEIMYDKHLISTSAPDAAIKSISQQIPDIFNEHVEGTSEIADCPASAEFDYHLTVCDSPVATNTSFHIYYGSDNKLYSDSAINRDTENMVDKEIPSVITRSSYTSKVDFEIPILEVKFDSGNMSRANSTLESLLTDMDETSVIASQQESEGNLISLEMNLGSLENGEASSSGSENLLLVELDGDGVEEVSSDVKQQEDNKTCINQETFASLI